MRKLKIIEHISLDGVQTSSGPEGDFTYGDWTAQYRSPGGLQVVTELYGQSCDLLAGRRTYDLLASFWPKAPRGPIGELMNASTKYVVTHRPESLEWGPFEAVGPDVLVDSVRRIKAKSGPQIMVPGSSSVATALLVHGLADEVILLVNPILLGKGKRLFADGGLPRGFALGSTKALPSGILVNVYKLIPTLAEEALSRAKLEREIEIAREVQERLFPQTFPSVAGVEMAAHCLKQKMHLLPLTKGPRAAATLIGIAIGDVSGKGI